jgi:hypothetical protein
MFRKMTISVFIMWIFLCYFDIWVNIFKTSLNFGGFEVLNAKKGGVYQDISVEALICFDCLLSPSGGI